MKRVVIAMFGLFLAFTVRTLAAPPPHLNWGAQINGVCSMDGDLVINAVMKISGDADSGQAGNYWGMDTFNKNIQVWTTDTPGVYCARVMYLGKFQAVAGQISPGNAGALTGAEKGSIEGGYMATVTGTLNPNPAWQTNGMVGSFDLGCNLSGNCPGAAAADWSQIYFNSGASITLNWWGWIYHGGKYGTWKNSIDGNEGNIIGS